MFIIVEEGWYYTNYFGPFSTKEEAEKVKPKSWTKGRLEAQTRFIVKELKKLGDNK